MIFTASDVVDVIEGRRKRPCIKGILRIMSCLFKIGVTLRNFAFDWRLVSPRKVSIPVISIGNIVAGGTGKTPFTERLAKDLSALGKVAIVSRGYRSQIEKEGGTLFLNQCEQIDAKRCGDEPYLLFKSLPKADLFIGKDRVQSAQRAVTERADVILLDDGMQYRLLHRDIEIVMLHGDNLYGKGFYLPLGYLRDCPKRLKKADAIVVHSVQSRLHFVEIQSEIRKKTKAPIIGTKMVPIGVEMDDGKKCVDLKKIPIGAFCALGSPTSFFNTLREMGADLTCTWSLLDHTCPTKEALILFALKCKEKGCKLLICSEKDRVKLPPSLDLSIPLGTLKATLEVHFGKRHYERLLQAIQTFIVSKKSGTCSFNQSHYCGKSKMLNEDEIEIHLPKLGESITSASIVQWFKKEGDSIELDEPLLEVSTDKVSSEIPSPVEGILAQIVVRPDEEVSVGTLLARITPKKVPPMPKEEQVKAKTAPSCVNKKFYTPVVAQIAQKEGISFSELECIPGTGIGGRLSKRDLEIYLTHRNETPISQAQLSERIKMSPMRKKIAEAMVHSFYSAPHATVVNEVDVTRLVQHIKRIKKEFFEKNGYKITITSYVIRAIGAAIKKYPLINASLDGETILIKKRLHLGLAISAFDGILVPVIQDADTLSLQEIARVVADRIEKARTKKLSPKDMGGGTFTLTNFGMEGALFGTPIIRHPEVAILGVGAIHQKVAVLKENTVAICSAVHLSCSFDHRVFDGIYACGFIKEVKKELEEAIDSSKD